MAAIFFIPIIVFKNDDVDFVISDRLHSHRVPKLSSCSKSSHGSEKADVNDMSTDDFDKVLDETHSEMNQMNGNTAHSTPVYVFLALLVAALPIDFFHLSMWVVL